MLCQEPDFRGIFKFSDFQIIRVIFVAEIDLCLSKKTLMLRL
jgi:hypothetical protein